MCIQLKFRYHYFKPGILDKLMFQISLYVYSISRNNIKNKNLKIS